jgi:hypothetical protein
MLDDFITFTFGVMIHFLMVMLVLHNTDVTEMQVGLGLLCCIAARVNMK